MEKEEEEEEEEQEEEEVEEEYVYTTSSNIAKHIMIYRSARHETKFMKQVMGCKNISFTTSSGQS